MSTRRIPPLLGPLALTLLAAAAGCGGYPPPQEGITRATAASRSAQELGADGVARGQLHLKRAKDQIAQAESLMKDGKNKRADYVLRRANADAELAVMLAKEHNAQLEAAAALERVKALRGGK